MHGLAEQRPSQPRCGNRIERQKHSDPGGRLMLESVEQQK
jgi:hypothetical protein